MLEPSYWLSFSDLQQRTLGRQVRASTLHVIIQNVRRKNDTVLFNQKIFLTNSPSDSPLNYSRMLPDLRHLLEHLLIKDFWWLRGKNQIYRGGRISRQRQLPGQIVCDGKGWSLVSKVVLHSLYSPSQISSKKPENCM